MSNTIQVEIFAPGVGQLESINEFFEKQAGKFKVSDDDVLFIELKQMPGILSKLETVGYFEDDNCVKWSLTGVSEEFIEIWVCCFEGDGCIFIPWDNVLAMHTVNQEWLKIVATRGRSGWGRQGREKSE